MAFPGLRAGGIQRRSVYRSMRKHLRKRGLGMNCQLRKEDELHAVCTVCGRRIRTSYYPLVKVKCPGKRELSTAGKLKNYARAVTRHILTGCETRTDEEVSELLNICRTCDHYQNGTCSVCGCRINSGKSAFANKLRMKTQKCPKGKWK